MEYIEEFNDLSSHMVKIGLEWIVEQVNEEILVGKFIEEKVSTLKESGGENNVRLFSERFKKGQKADFVKRADYTDKEKLILMLEAIQRGVFEPSDMQQYLINELEGDIEKIEFIPDVGEEEWVISRDIEDIQVNTSIRKPIQELLSELRGEN